MIMLTRYGVPPQKKTFITFFRKSTISESAAESDITVTPSLVQKTLNMMH